MNFDVAIVGGSFAGLSSAYFLAREGLDVCLFESRKIGTSTKSTGIFTKSVIKDLNVPKDLIESEIFGTYFYSPNMTEYEYRFSKPLFYQSNTLKFIKWLKSKVLDKGASLFEKKSVSNIRFLPDKVVVEDVNAKLIIISTGPRPSLVQEVKPQQVLYSGLEYIAKCNNIKDENMVQVYFDYEICPGYFSWIAPNNDKVAHIGVLRKLDGTAAITAMKIFMEKIKLDLKRVYETRGGAVPLSAPIKKTYGERFVLIGDAASQIGAFSSAGINYSIRTAKILSKVLHNHLDNLNEANLNEYEKSWKSDVGKVLNEEWELRRIYDLANSNEKLEKALKLLSRLPKRKIFELINNFSNLEPLNYKKILFPLISKETIKYAKIKVSEKTGRLFNKQQFYL